MCFSAQADVAGGVVASLIGVDALRHVRVRSERLLASMPLLFGLHQFTEAFVWWGLNDRVPWSVGGSAVWVYLAFAFSVLPVLVPIAVRAVEPDPGRRKAMAAFAVLGAVVGAIYLAAMLAQPVGAQIDGHTVVYTNHLSDGGIVDALYVLVTCGPLIVSSHRRVVGFGVVNLAAVAVLLWLGSNAKTSLWCAWAALTSLAIALHLRGTPQFTLRRFTRVAMQPDDRRRASRWPDDRSGEL